MFADPVPIQTEPLFAVATIVWRHAGVLYVTAIAKRSFSLDVASGARAIRPAPIARVEVDAGFGRILPDEVAPCLVGGEVWVVGRVRAAPPTVNVTLRVRRAGAAILERRASVAVDANGTAGLGVFGPLSKRWPARASRLGGVSAASLEGPLIALGDSVDWRYFQAAPNEQMVPWLAPGDDVAIEVAGLGALSLTLPAELAVASIAEPGRAPEGFDLRPDVVAIDVDASIAQVIYRGRATLDGDPRRARIDVRLGTAVVRPANAERPSDRASAPDGGPGASDQARTAMISDDEVRALRAKYALPFQAKGEQKAPTYEPPPAPPRPRVGSETLVADEGEIAALRAQFMPFVKSAAPDVRALPPPPIAASPLPLAPDLSPYATAPFTLPPPPRLPPAPEKLAPFAGSPIDGKTTTLVDADDLAELRAQYATPFEKPSAKLARSRGPAALPKPAASAKVAQSGTTSALTADEAAKLREEFAPAFLKARAAQAAEEKAKADAAKPAGASFLDSIEGDGKKRT
jgi:hypothetical protein